MRRLLLAIALVTVGCSNVSINAGPTPSPITSVLFVNAPASGDIRFGPSFDVTTFAIASPFTTTDAGQPVAFVAHLSRASRGEAFNLKVERGGQAGVYPLGSLDSGLDIAGGTILPATVSLPGTYRISVVDVGGSSVASAELTIR